MTTKAEIFKIQKSVDGSNMCLIYNKDRSIMGQFPATPDDDLILGGGYKNYFWGTYNEKTTKTEYIRDVSKEELKKIDW